MHSDSILNCRVCGYESDLPSWGKDGRCPSFEFCPCCGVEHGYQDATPAGAKAYRAQWLACGAVWEIPAEQPASWIAEAQLQFVPKEFQ